MARALIKTPTTVAEMVQAILGQGRFAPKAHGTFCLTNIDGDILGVPITNRTFGSDGTYISPVEVSAS